MFLGRVVRPGRDPLWTEDDQDKAIEWTRRRARRCPGCGTMPEEWERDPVAYVAGSSRCLGCEALEQERANVPDHAKGVRIYLTPNPHDDDDDEADEPRGDG